VKLLLLLQVAIGDSLAGTWQAALDLAGGALPFEITLARSPDGWRGELSELPQSWRSFSAVLVTSDTVVLEMADYDATITAALDGDSLKGYYHNVGSNGPRTIPFRAQKGTRQRVRGPRALLGRWDATYFQESGTSRRVFEFRNGHRGFEGTIISSTTDYGPFRGEVVADSFAIGLFDGSFVYLLTGKLKGDTLRGTFHAGLRSQTQWEAVRSTGKPHLRSPTEITQADTTEPLRFGFPDLQGRMVRHDDSRFKGKVVLLDVFGTWCPTCHDATPELLRLYRKYHSRGLEVVGLAFEATGDTAVDARQVRRYREKFRIPFPLLLAGTSDAGSMADALPQLQDLTAFPTAIFLGRDGRVRRVHAGFHGLAAGPQHQQMVREFEREIEKLLQERVKTEKEKVK
jgi:thiol-disulfide isomerase/thioredoxin